MQIIGTIQLTVLSAAMNAAIEQRTRAELEMTEEDIFAAIAPYAERVGESGRFPRVTEVLAQVGRERGKDDPEQEMLGAVDLILDGIAARVEAAGERAAPPR